MHVEKAGAWGDFIGISSSWCQFILFSWNSQCSLLIPLKTSENKRFSDVFRGTKGFLTFLRDQKETLTRKGFKEILIAFQVFYAKFISVLILNSKNCIAHKFMHIKISFFRGLTCIFYLKILSEICRL